jgi:hypothetical protein
MSAPNSADKVYATSPIRRVRATKAEMEARLDALAEIVDEIRPCTVRQVFYQAVVRGLIEKTEDGYSKVQRALVDLRRSGCIDYRDIADNTRWMRKPTTYNGIEDALFQTARLYRRNVWRDLPDYAEVWIEKDALAGVIYEITDLYDVPLMVSRGFASLSFLYEAASSISATGKPAYIYHLGDYDPSGVAAARKIEQTLRELAPDSDIHFERLAVMPEQIVDLDLPTRPTKTTDSRSRGFGDISVELDAIAPETLRQIVESAIERHVPDGLLAKLEVAENSERKIISLMAGFAPLDREAQP